MRCVLSPFVLVFALVSCQLQTPTDVALQEAAANGLEVVSAGYDHTCALTADGTAYCWGVNGYGELGHAPDATETCEEEVGHVGLAPPQGPPIACRTRPTQVDTDLRFREIGAGHQFTCGLVKDGAAYCWGRNDFGMLGTPLTSGSHQPVPVAGSHSFTRLTVGWSHACGLAQDGSAYCWGFNVSGQLGNGAGGPDLHRFEPTRVVGDYSFVAIDAGPEATCAVTAEGEGYCWGRNDHGQLGDGSRSYTGRDTPARVEGGVRFGRILPGMGTCGLDREGRVHCWGRAHLGTQAVNESPTPVRVDTDLTFTSLAAGISHACAVAETGSAYCWGSNAYGALGAGAGGGYGTRSPVQVAGGYDFTSITISNMHTCATTGAGEILCWGHNRYGQLGDRTTEHRAEPAQTLTPEEV